MHQPSEAHMNVVTRIMRYLKGAPAKGLMFSKHTPMDLEGYTNADWAGSITKPVQHDRTKHVEVDRHFIKEKLERGIIKFPFVNSENQLADILTKSVSSKVFYDSLDKLGMRDIFAPT
ncbi:hypothetical protein ACE6H2_020413 [Prunus campanulata]